MDIAKAKSQLAEYGYTLSDSLQIQKGEKTFSVVVKREGSAVLRQAAQRGAALERSPPW